MSDGRCEEHDNWHAHCQQCCRAEVATLKAQLAALTEERDRAQEAANDYQEEKHKAMDREERQCTQAIHAEECATEECVRADAAEAALLFLREKLCPDVTVWPDVPHDVACAILDRVRSAESVVAGANRALREALREAVSSARAGSGSDAKWHHSAESLLAAPPVADPRAEALASALEKLLISENYDEEDSPMRFSCAAAARAALAAWRGR